MERKLAGILQSSQDPSQVANKVKGTILAFSGVVILVAARIFHITLTADDVVQLAGEIGTLAGAIWAIYGCVLNLITWLGTVKTEQVTTTTV